MLNKRIMITGAAGYIGSILARTLLERGYSVIGLDNLLYGDHSIRDLSQNAQFKFVRGDIRDYSTYENALEEIDGIVHLAAIVGEPACAINYELAIETNLEGSKLLFESARAHANIRRFVFASTCSNYGVSSGNGLSTEDSGLDPIGLYAETKVDFEKYLLDSSPNNGFSPTILRFATAYGLSPRMRFDLTVNEFTREIATGKELVIYGKHMWRPYCHAEDLAGACVAALEADRSLVDYEVYNVGDSEENYTKESIADLLLEFRPEANLRFIDKVVDRRDYKVSFLKIGEKLSFQSKKTVRKGVEEILAMISAGKFPDPYSARFRNT